MDPPSYAYEIENFDPHPTQETVCSICHSVMQNPAQCPCKHVFCRRCIDQWLENNSNCPVCRRSVSQKTVADASAEFKSLIMDLELRCPHAPGGCAAKFTLRNCSHHLQECEYELTNEERLSVQPNTPFVTRLLKASRDKSLHHLIPKILRTEKETINVRAIEPPDDPIAGLSMTPLMLALGNGCSLEILNVLLEAGAEVTAEDESEDNALHHAFYGKCPLSVFERLLQCNKGIVNQKDISREVPFHCGLNLTPLMWGLSVGCSLDVFRAFLEAGVDLTVSCKCSYTHLHHASTGGCREEILREIIRAEPDLISRRTESGRIPLHYAEKEWVVRTLVEAGSDVGARDKDGNTPLQCALEIRSIDDSTFEFYLELMSTKQLKQVNNQGDTLLHSVCKRDGRDQFVQRLMKLGLDPAKQNKRGETALHHGNGCQELLRGRPHLVEIENNEGMSAIEVTCRIRCLTRVRPALTHLTKTMVKWVSLQNEGVAQRAIRAIQDQSCKNDVALFLEACQADLKLLEEHCVSGVFSLRDLLLKEYLTGNDSGLKEHVVALNFDARRLSVFAEEVLELQKKVREE